MRQGPVQEPFAEARAGSGASWSASYFVGTRDYCSYTELLLITMVTIVTTSYYSYST